MRNPHFDWALCLGRPAQAWRESKVFRHALRRGEMALNRRVSRVSRRRGVSPPLLPALSVQFFPFRGVTPFRSTAGYMRPRAVPPAGPGPRRAAISPKIIAARVVHGRKTHLGTE